MPFKNGYDSLYIFTSSDIILAQEVQLNEKCQGGKEKLTGCLGI